MESMTPFHELIVPVMPNILNPSQHFSSVCFAAHFMVFKSEVEMIFNYRNEPVRC